MKNILLLVFIFTISESVFAQIITSPLVGMDINGSTITVTPEPGKSAVLIFTSTDCPYDDQYIERIQELVKQYGDRLSFFLINASPEDTPQRIRAKVTSWQLGFPCVQDYDQIIFKTLAARKTMEAFIISNIKSNLKIIYRGPIDDNPQVADDADFHYLADAIQHYLNGQQVINPEARVTGCIIRTRN